MYVLHLLWVAAAQPLPLDGVLAQAERFGGPSGHCPVPGQPAGRSHGSEWRAIGFSARGAFASVQLRTSDMGPPRWVASVVSLVDDKVLDRVMMEAGGDDPPPPLEAFLAAERPAIEAMLAKHGVVPAVHPLQREALSVVVKEEPHELWKSFRVRAVRSDGSAKNVGTLVGKLSVEVLGVLQSPFEPDPPTGRQCSRSSPPSMVTMLPVTNPASLDAK